MSYTPKAVIKLEILVGDKHITIPIKDEGLYDSLSFITGQTDAKIWLTASLDIKTEEEYQEFLKSFKNK